MPIKTVCLTTSGLLGVYVYFVVDFEKHIIEMSFPVVAFLLCSLLGFRFRKVSMYYMQGYHLNVFPSPFPNENCYKYCVITWVS